MGKLAHSESQRRAMVIRGRWSGNPSLLITVLDSFNDLLLQRFSRGNSLLRAAFRKAARKSKIPDYGNWLRHPKVAGLLPKACPILLDCHNLRLRAEIAHATIKKTGRFTRRVTYREKEIIIKQLRLAYTEWFAEWKKC
jgi:hypothetical protein